MGISSCLNRSYLQTNCKASSCLFWEQNRLLHTSRSNQIRQLLSNDPEEMDHTEVTHFLQGWYSLALPKVTNHVFQLQHLKRQEKYHSTSTDAFFQIYLFIFLLWLLISHSHVWKGKRKTSSKSWSGQTGVDICKNDLIITCLRWTILNFLDGFLIKRWDAKCAQMLFFNVAPTKYMSTGIWNRLAALATHGRQNCKQSGVVLERTVNSTANE